MTDAELNEAYAIYVEGETVNGGFIIQLEHYGLFTHLTPRKIPDYCKEMGREAVLKMLENKLCGAPA